MAFTWPSKDPAEKFAVRFDFSAELASITACDVTVEVVSGNDPDALILDGDPQINGRSVLQRVHNGLHKCSYRLKCTATDGTEVWALAETLPVRVK